MPWERVELSRDQIPVVFETTAYTIPPPRPKTGTSRPMSGIRGSAGAPAPSKLFFRHHGLRPIPAIAWNTRQIGPEPLNSISFIHQFKDKRKLVLGVRFDLKEPCKFRFKEQIILRCGAVSVFGDIELEIRSVFLVGPVQEHDNVGVLLN